MELGFHDELTSKVDAKGRVSIPAAHRAVLVEGDPSSEGKNPRMVLIHGKSHEHCLRGFTVQAYKKMRQQIEDMPYGPDRTRAAKALISKAMTVPVDDNGRIILRKDIRERFDIENAAVFVGTAEHLQIWNPDIYYDLEEEEGVDPFVLLNAAIPEGQ